jgi:hypothetical protein
MRKWFVRNWKFLLGLVLSLVLGVAIAFLCLSNPLVLSAISALSLAGIQPLLFLVTLSHTAACIIVGGMGTCVGLIVTALFNIAHAVTNAIDRWLRPYQEKPEEYSHVNPREIPQSLVEVLEKLGFHKQQEVAPDTPLPQSSQELAYPRKKSSDHGESRPYYNLIP